MKAPLTIPQTITLLRNKYPDGLVCSSCAKLLASRGFEGREYTCAECQSDAKESVPLEKTKTPKAPRGAYLEVVTKAEPQPFDQESLALLRAAHRLEVEGEAKPGKLKKGAEGTDIRVSGKKAKSENRAPEARINTGDSEAKSVTAQSDPTPRRRRGPSDRRRLSPQVRARLKEKALAAKQAARERVRAYRARKVRKREAAA